MDRRMKIDAMACMIRSVLENRLFFFVAMVAVSLWVLWSTSNGDMWGDLNHYYNNAGDVLSGLMPYSEMAFEYPPLSLVFMLIPRLLTWDVESFYYGCTILTYVFIAIGSYFLLRIADERIGCRWQTHLILISFLLFGGYFVIARNDVYPTVFVIIAFWFYLKDRYVLAFVIMAVAAMTKMYPAIFLIPMLIPFILRKQWRTGILCLLSAAVVCLVVELPFLIADPSTAFAYLSYHSDRGIQVESVAASFFMVYNILVPGDLSVVFGYGSDNLSGVGPEALSPYMNFLMAIVLLLFIIAMAFRIHKFCPLDKMGPMIMLISVAMLALFIAFSKVYSAQYIIWIMMVLPLTQMSCFGSTRRFEVLAIMIPFGIFSVCSYVGYNTFGLPELDHAAVCLTALKNVFHVLLTVMLLRMCWMEAARGDKTEVSREVPS